jgi:hypothetical protein
MFNDYRGRKVFVHREGRGFRMGHSTEGALMLKADGRWPVRGSVWAKNGSYRVLGEVGCHLGAT